MQSHAQQISAWRYLEWFPLLPLCSRFLLLAPSKQPPLHFPPRQSTLSTAETSTWKMDTNFVTRQEKLYFRRFSNGSNLVKETFRPAGNSRVWQAMGGRNCFTITTQSLCSVRFSRAIIPTPGGEVCYSQQHLYQAVKTYTYLYNWMCSPSASVLVCLVVLFTVSQVLVDEKKRKKGGERGGQNDTCVWLRGLWQSIRTTVPGASGPVHVRGLLQLYPLACHHELQNTPLCDHNRLQLNSLVEKLVT